MSSADTSVPRRPGRDAFLYTYYFEPPYPTPTSHALVTERSKLVEFDGLPTELYDLQADPRERADLATSPEHAEIRTRLERRLAELRTEIER